MQLHITNGMAPCWDDAMSFNPDIHNNENLSIDNVHAQLSVWIKDLRTLTFNDYIASVFTIREGNFNFHITMNEDNSNALIHALHQHIANIKAAEIEMIAQNIQVAA